MKRILLCTALAAVIFSFSGQAELHGETRGRGRLLWRLQPPPAAPRPAPTPRFTPYRSVEDLYPRYYGSFHWRYFQDLGVPPGDVGLRGNGLYWTPW